MKIKVNVKKFISVLLVSVLIMCMVACNAMPVKAAELPIPEVTSLKLIDMCLTRSGKVVNSDIRNDVLTQTRNVLNDTAQSYWQWCSDNGKEKSVETFREYLESDAYASLPFRLSKYPLNLASFINWMITGETLLDVLGTDVNDVLIEYDENGNATVPSESVNIINQSFDKVKGNYTSGWRYVDVQPSSELPSTWFGDKGSWQNVKDLIDSSENPTYIFYNKNYPSYANVYHIVDNTQLLYAVELHGGYSGGGIRSSFFFYDTNWNEYGMGVQFLTGVQQFDISADNISEKLIDLRTSNCMWYKTDRVDWLQANDVGSTKYSAVWVFGKMDKTIVYNSLQAVKDYSCGQQPYYLTNRQYQDSVDNSFNVSGEYIHNDGGSFAYEQIREQINNSNVTNDNSANSIINDYSQTIINNYNYSSGSGGNGSGDNGSDNNNSILDGLGSIISAITEIIGFLLSVIGDIISLIGNLFDTVFNGIKSIGGIFTGFTGLLSELFVFIPKELIDFLCLAIEASIGIAIWRKFSKK